HIFEARNPPIFALVHVERAVDLDLRGMKSRGRIAVMFGDKTAGIRLVAQDAVAEIAQGFLDHIGHQRRATGAVAVAKGDIGSRLTSRNERGKCARISGTSRRTASAKRSSTKVASERRKTERSNLVWARNAAGYERPL